VRLKGFKTFRGYAGSRGAIVGQAAGNCLDGLPAGTIEWFDPRVEIEDGDVCLIRLAEPLRGAHFAVKRCYRPSGWSKYWQIATDNPPWRGELDDRHKIIGPLVAAWTPWKWLRWLIHDHAATAETDRVGREFAEQSNAARSQ
jgi:hypothetical protein